MAALALGGLLMAAPAASAAPDWDRIIECESGGDFQAVNQAGSSASGGFQITDGTWRAYGGSTASAADASVAEQYRVAARIYADRGYQPWKASASCHGLS